MNLLILDYEMGNLLSVKKAIDYISKDDAIISSEPSDIAKADKIIMPGVGHFSQAMTKLVEKDLVIHLNEAVINKNVPILGICLGMQLMSSFSEEGSVEGLGWVDAQVLKLKPEDKSKFKVPHIGWNRVKNQESNILFNSSKPDDEYYFVHSYYVSLTDQSVKKSYTKYSNTFCSAFQLENIFGVQFHPEKSHDAGLNLFKNFIEL